MTQATLTKPKPATVQLLLVRVANIAHPKGAAMFDAEARWMPMGQAERFDPFLRATNTPQCPALSGRQVPTPMDIEKLQRYEAQIAAVPDMFAVQRSLGRTYQDPGLWLVSGPNVLTQSPVGQNPAGVWETKEGVTWVAGPYVTIAEARAEHPEIPPADMAPVPAAAKETPATLAQRKQVAQLQEALNQQMALRHAQVGEGKARAEDMNDRVGKATDDKEKDKGEQPRA